MVSAIHGEHVFGTSGGEGPWWFTGDYTISILTEIGDYLVAWAAGTLAANNATLLVTAGQAQIYVCGTGLTTLYRQDSCAYWTGILVHRPSGFISNEWNPGARQ